MVNSSSSDLTTADKPYIQQTTHWEIYDPLLAIQILEHPHVVQSGFGAADFHELPAYIKPPMLFADGEDHRRFRVLTGPLYTNSNKEMVLTAIDPLIKSVIDRLKQAGSIPLNQEAMKIGTALMGRLLGIDPKHDVRLAARLERFFPTRSSRGSSQFGQWWKGIQRQSILFQSYWFMVRPAIKGLMDQPENNVISLLLEEGHSDLEITAEMLTYAAIGVTSLRTMIPLIASQLMQDDQYRVQFLAAAPETRTQMIGQIVERDPPIPALIRTSTGPIELVSGELRLSIPADQTIQLFLQLKENLSEPEAFSGAELPHHGSLAFGHGAHRCPAQSMVLDLSERLISQLLSVEGIKIRRPLQLTLNAENPYYYDISDFIVGI